MTTHSRLVVVASIVVLGWTSPALGQVFDLQDSGDDPYSRGYFSVLGGRLLDDPESAVFGVEFGERVTGIFDAFLNFTFAKDVMTPRMRLHLQEASAAWTEATGTPWEFTGRDRGLSVTYGGKLLLPRESPVRAYFGLGAGGMWLRRRIVEQSLGEITRDFSRQYGATDGNVGVGGTYSLKPLAEAIVGVSAGVNRLYVDVSVRRRRTFRTEERIDYTQFAAAAGFRF